MKHLTTPSRRLTALIVAVPFIAAACTSAAVDTTDGPILAAATETAATAAVEAPAPEQASGAEAPATEPTAEPATWRDIELTDAASGETFTLASLEGGVVAVEPMAIWCSNCKAQQDNVKEVYDRIEAAGVTYISLGIDPGEDPASLATYADRRGYGWTFVQSSTELSRALNDRFGPQILSAPSTPLIVLDANGDVAFQDFGFHGPEALMDILDDAANS